MGCQGSKSNVKQNTKNNPKGAGNQKSTGNQVAKPSTASSSGIVVATGQGGTQAAPQPKEYTSTKGIAYPSLEPPVIENKDAIEKGYISTKGAGQAKLDEQIKKNEAEKAKREEDER